jgi:lysyl-tRNA synthetase class I
MRNKTQRGYLRKPTWPSCELCESVKRTEINYIEKESKIIYRCKFDDEVVSPKGYCNEWAEK